MVVVIGASGGAEVERCVKCQSMTTDALLDEFRRNTDNLNGCFQNGNSHIKHALF